MTEEGLRLKKSNSSQGKTIRESLKSSYSEGTETFGQGQAFYHELKEIDPNDSQTDDIIEEKKKRRQLNKEARISVKGTFHEGVRLIVHRPEINEDMKKQYEFAKNDIWPTVKTLIKGTQSLFDYQVSGSQSGNKYYGTRFMADNVGKMDLRYFSRINPPDEQPSLAVALRIDESVSMKAFNRLEASKRAALAVYEFCRALNIPLSIYGDTADKSPMEEMSMYAYTDFDVHGPYDGCRLMAIQARSNNRDGMALRILAEKIMKRQEKTKLVISLCDGQPKAMPDYSGDLAVNDMKGVIGEYSRKGIVFLAAAIGKDKEMISDIFGQEQFMDITDIHKLPKRLVQVITRYI